MINRVFTCEIINKDIKQHDYSPEKVIIRFMERKQLMMSKDGKNFETHLKYVGEAAEAVIFNILSNENISPNLLGVFPGGRIEEFIEVFNI